MKLCFRYFILISSILLLTSFMVEVSASTNPEGKLIITGTGSNIGAMQRMGEGFQKKHLNVKDGRKMLSESGHAPLPRISGK